MEQSPINCNICKDKGWKFFVNQVIGQNPFGQQVIQQIQINYDQNQDIPASHLTLEACTCPVGQSQYSIE